MSITAPPRTLSPRRLYRLLAVAETITWTLLIVGMVLEYLVQVGDWPVRVFGLAHGVVFVAYALTALLVGVNQFWPLRQIVAAVATAVVPYATIPFDRSLERRGLLDGVWRLDATDDPRDHTRLSAALRFFLRHPVTLGVAMVITVVGIVGILLTLGPPTQWFDRPAP